LSRSGLFVWRVVCEWIESSAKTNPLISGASDRCER
jgi:hypothetical protein